MQNVKQNKTKRDKRIRKTISYHEQTTKKERKEYKRKKKKASSSLYKPEIPKPKRNMKKERKEYEQKYLSRYKQPKAKSTKSSNLKHDTDIRHINSRSIRQCKT